MSFLRICVGLLFVLFLCQSAVSDDKKDAAGAYSELKFPDTKANRTWLYRNLAQDLAYMPDTSQADISRATGQVSSVTAFLEDGQLKMATSYYVALREKANSEAELKKIMAAEGEFVKDAKSDTDKDGAVISVRLEPELTKKLMDKVTTQDKDIVKLSAALDVNPRTRILANIISGSLPGWRARNYAEAHRTAPAVLPVFVPNSGPNISEDNIIIRNGGDAARRTPEREHRFVPAPAPVKNDTGSITPTVGDRKNKTGS